MKAITAIALALCCAVGGASLAQQSAAVDEERPYLVTNGKVDRGTYNGYRRYGNSCLACHGPDGMGSSYAPRLVDSLKHLTREQFDEIVINGRQNVTSSQQNVMPSFGTTEDVVIYLADIYSYLKARSDGVLGRGRPVRAEE